MTVMTIIYHPAECYPACNDENCPYAHNESWAIMDERKIIVADGFRSEAEAIEALQRL